MTELAGAFAILGAPAPGSTTLSGQFEIEEKPPPLGDELTRQGFPFPFATPRSLTSGRVAVTRELPPDKLAIRVSPNGGAPVRFAADEPLAENVIDDIKFSGELNGGEKEASWSLARDPRIAFSDLPAYAPTEIYGPGVETVWTGRIDKTPKNDGDRKSIDPAAVGYKAALEDNRAAVAGFIQQDQSAWQGASAQRKIDLGAGWDQSAAPSLDADVATGVPAVNLTSTGQITKPVWSAVLDAGPAIRFGRVMGEVLPLNLGTHATDPSVFAQIIEADSDTFAAWAELGDVSAGGFFDYPVSSRRVVLFQGLYNAGPSGTAGVEYGYRLRRLIALGDAPLTLQGTWPEVGFTAKQMLAWVISNLTDLEVDESEMEDDGFVIPQAWFSEPTTVLAIVEELTKYGLLDWFVRGGKFHYRFPGTYGRRWQLYAGPSALKEQGLDASRLWRSIVVRYQDVDGTTRTVGPPGSGAMVEDAGLEVTDPDHPAVRAGITRQDVLDLQGIGVASQAIATGERWLEEANLLSRSGSCTATGYAMDDRGVMRPVSQIREGDLVRFPDAGGDTGYRKVQSFEYTHSTRSSSLALDAPKESVIALLERFNAKLTSLGVS